MADRLDRRSLLIATLGTATALAGCSSDSSSPERPETDTPESTPTGTETPAADSSATPTETPDPTASPTPEPETKLDVQGAVSSTSIRAGETVTVELTVTNEGPDRAETTLTVRLGAETVASAELSVPAGDSVTLSRETPPVDRYGSVRVSVDDSYLDTVDVTHPPEIHVTTDGDDDNPGTETSPLATVQAGVDRARTGETVRVHPGEYSESVITRRSGAPEKPITITGPTDAVLTGRPDGWRAVVEIHHSHITLEGLTITGLLDPDEPENPDSYRDTALVAVAPPTGSGQLERSDQYLNDIVVTPDRIGNTGRNMIIVWRTTGIEIGEFKIIGPAGASWVFNEKTDHVGEIVYLGQAPANIVGKDFDWYPWDRYDETRGVHIHHIDNTAGHPHAELVDCKLGTHDVTIEYCTDAGGSQNNETYIPSSIALRGHDATVRWNRLADGSGHGIEIRDQRGYSGPRIEGEPRELVENAGTGNDIYGNEISGFDGEAVTLPEWLDGEPREQGHICGNEVSGETDFDPETTCSGSVPAGDGVGHLSGESPHSA